ncbi:MAG: LuxR C-terminal-related transcriptional regulator [Gammaproteobacteria bacterium]|nr:LuxR C-terminal-related transcriptional regulator [Gammaproteobacteria bacterium]
MTVTDQASVPAGAHRARPLEPPWLLTTRVTIPERVDGYLRRPQLRRRCQPLNRRLTVFHAPCGFGKTALLADICQRERAGGVLTAWLSLDETDSTDTLAAYIEFALTRAGLDTSMQRSPESQSPRTIDHPARATLYRMGLVMRAIEDYRMPCLLAFDEVERLVGAEQIRLIDFVLHRAPRNLHFAMSMRSSPPGLDLASAVMDGLGDILRADDFRFAKPEIAVFFGGQLSRPELAETTERTEGWPAALRIYRNSRTDVGMSGEEGQDPGSRPEEGYAGIAAKFLASRLRRDLKDDEVDYLLDVSLFDPMDLKVVEEVLPETHLKLGANVLSKFDGLVRPVDTSAGILRLHPLVKEYCARRRFQKTPWRFRMLHGRIATALARRGRLEPALRHAADSGDHILMGSILEAAGGVRLWCTHGMEEFLAWDRFLTAEVLAAFPRLAFLRCAALVARSDLGQALALYTAVRDKTGGFRRDREGGDDSALWIDSILVRSTLVIFDCQPLGSEIVENVLADAGKLATDGQLDPVARGLLNTILCIADYQRARFASSQWLGTQAKQCFVLADARYGSVLNDFQLGMVAMAEGRIEEAARSYARRSPALISHILMAELDLERNQLKPHRRVKSWVPLRIVERSLDVHAAAYGVVAELAFEKEGATGALRVLEDALDFAIAERLTRLVCHLSALRVSYLVIGGRVAEASQVWHDARLPECQSRLLDLDGQSWREMESISCARIRLLASRHEFKAARELAEQLHDVARTRGLMRTRMRCIALWMSLEYRSGDVNAAASRLLEFLGLLRATDYGRPLVRESEVGRVLLARVMGMALEPQVRSSAEFLLKRMEGPLAGDEGQTPLYTARELEVIEHVARGLRDKQVARHLGVTEHGVRYHLRNVFRKIGAASRMDAVRRARNLGIIH